MSHGASGEKTSLLNTKRLKGYKVKSCLYQINGREINNVKERLEEQQTRLCADEKSGKQCLMYTVPNLNLTAGTKRKSGKSWRLQTSETDNNKTLF